MDTVEARIQRSLYTTVDSVAEDFIALLDQEANLRNGKADMEDTSPPLDDVSGNNTTTYGALRKFLNRFVSEWPPKADKVKIEGSDESVSMPGQFPEADSAKNRLVLTLFGSTDRGPKQLFSSLQLPPTSDHRGTTFKQDEESKYAYAKVEEKSLPIGITATKIVPLNPEQTPSDPKKVPTFGQVFRPHHSLKTLEPPKPSDTSSKDTTISWAQPNSDAEFTRATPAEKGDYKYSQLPAGHWLQFTGPKTAAEIKVANTYGFRNRGVEDSDKAKSLQPTPEEVQAAQVKATFQRAYSSFAPVYDDAEAIIAEKVKNQIWWKKSGSARFKSLLGANDISLNIPESLRETPESHDQSLSEQDFSEAVASFVPIEEAGAVGKSDSVAEKDMKDLLEEISEHLRTLVSYQQTRHLTQPASKAINGDQASFSTPSSAESQVYSLLKSQLSLMISSLPPYAVAKLDGDQLRALDISTKVLTPQDDYAGVMEVDDFTLAKQRATASASAAASRPATTAQPRAGGYNTGAAPLNYNQRAYAAGVRTPSVPAPYSSRPTYSGATPSQNYAAGARPVPQTVPRYGMTQQYASSPIVQQFQRPLPNGYSGSYNSHQQAQNAASAYPQRPSQPGYQQRAQDNAARSTSPQKPMDILSARTSYPGGLGAAQPRYFQQQQQQSGSQGSPSPAPPNTNAPSPLDRAKMSASYPSQRPASTTPQPPNGQPHERSLTPGGSHPDGGLPSASPIQNQ